MAALPVSVLRELFRNLQSFRSVYETDGIDEVVGPDGVHYCLWDLEYLYKQLHRLPRRQAQAIELCLVQNMRECDAAQVMGVSPTNPVAMYAKSGLEKLVFMAEEGVLPGFRGDDYGTLGAAG